MTQPCGSLTAALYRSGPQLKTSKTLLVGVLEVPLPRMRSRTSVLCLLPDTPDSTMLPIPNTIPESHH